MKFLSFKDLQARGIVTNWPTLNRLIEKENFPGGFRLGQARRVWQEAQVLAWIETREIKCKVPA
jgi:predicted DNA-binding transcriptional regulator AlpA